MIQARNIYFLELVFIKNRKPYEDYQAKAWFKSLFIKKEEKTSKALSFMRNLLKDAQMPF